MKKVLTAIFILGIVAAGLAFGFVVGIIQHFSADLPDLVSAANYQPKQMSRVYSADGRIIGEWGVERRTLVPFGTIPQVLKDAVVSAEDGNYYTHKGLDYLGMLRALYAALQERQFTQGASTITQQVIKTFLLTPEKKFSRKIQEAILARRLEQNLSKDEILYLYLNQIYFGHGCYGVEEASRFFFGKGVAEIGVEEASLLAGLPQMPERVSPIRHAEAARNRRAYVLSQMAANGYLTEEEADEIKDKPLEITAHRPPDIGVAPHFVEHVRRILSAELGSTSIYEGGLRVYTTLDVVKQGAANDGVAMGLDAIDMRKRFFRPLRTLKTEQRQNRFLQDNTKKLVNTRLRPGVILEGLVTQVDKEAGGYWVSLDSNRKGLLRSRWLERYLQPDPPRRGQKAPPEPERKDPFGQFEPGDVVRVGIAEEKARDGSMLLLPEFGPQGIFVAMHPETREIQAMVGGDPRLPGAFNRVTQAHRQPGSAFKPVIYSAALETEKYTAASVLLDSPEVYLLHDGTRWTPQNYDQKFRGPMRLRDALASSVNMISIRILADIGFEVVMDYAERIGIQTKLDPYLPLALGSTVMTPLELTNTYAVWASGGFKGDPVFIRRVETSSGVVLYEQEANLERAIPETLAYLTNNLLQGVTQSGTAARVGRAIKGATAGKTGTTNDLTDTWFVGYTPSMVGTVWIGYDDNKTLGSGEQGSRTAVPVWLHYMEKVMAEQALDVEGGAEEEEEEDFRMPERGIEVRYIDPITGLLAPPGMEETVKEVFLRGTAPRTYATLPGESDEESFLLDQTGALMGFDDLEPLPDSNVVDKDDEPVNPHSAFDGSD